MASIASYQNSLVISNISGDQQLFQSIKQEVQKYQERIDTVRSAALKRLEGLQSENTQLITYVSQQSEEKLEELKRLIYFQDDEESQSLEYCIGLMQSEATLKRIRSLAEDRNHAVQKIDAYFKEKIQEIESYLNVHVIEKYIKKIANQLESRFNSNRAKFKVHADRYLNSIRKSQQVFVELMADPQLSSVDTYRILSQEMEAKKSELQKEGEKACQQIKDMGIGKCTFLNTIKMQLLNQIRQCCEEAKTSLQKLFLRELRTDQHSINGYHAAQISNLAQKVSAICQETLNDYKVSIISSINAHAEHLNRQVELQFEKDQKELQLLCEQADAINHYFNQQVKTLLKVLQEQQKPYISGEIAPITRYATNDRNCCFDDGFSEDHIQAHGIIRHIDYRLYGGTWLQAIRLRFEDQQFSKYDAPQKGEGILTDTISLSYREKINQITVFFNHDGSGCAHSHTRGVGGISMHTNYGKTYNIGHCSTATVGGLPTTSKVINFGPETYLAGFKGRTLRCKPGTSECAHQFHNVSTFHNFYFYFLNDLSSYLQRENLLGQSSSVLSRIREIRGRMPLALSINSSLPISQAACLKIQPKADPYALLGLPKGITQGELQTIRRRDLRGYHPDTSLDPYVKSQFHGRFCQLTQAYETLQQNLSSGTALATSSSVNQPTAASGALERQFRQARTHFSDTSVIESLEKARDQILEISAKIATDATKMMHRIASGEEKSEDRLTLLTAKTEMLQSFMQDLIKNCDQQTEIQTTVGDEILKYCETSIEQISQSRRHDLDYLKKELEIIHDQGEFSTTTYLQAHMQSMKEEALAMDQNIRLARLYSKKRDQDIKHQLDKSAQNLRELRDRRRITLERESLEQNHRRQRDIYKEERRTYDLYGVD